MERILLLDIFAQPLQLNVGGSTVFRTKSGIAMAFIYLAALTVLLYTEINSYLRKLDPNTSRDLFYTTPYHNINLDTLGYLPIIVGYLGATTTIPASQMSRYFTTFIQKTTYTAVVLSNNGELSYEADSINFYFVPCSSLSEKEKSKFSFAKNDTFIDKVWDKYALCPQTNSTLSIAGKPSDDIFESVSVYVKPCSLESGCASFEELSQANVQILNPTIALNVTNIEEPLKSTVGNLNYYYINFVSTQQFNSRMQLIQVRDFVGIIPSWQLVTQLYDIEGTTVNQLYRDSSQLSCSKEKAFSDDSSLCKAYIEFALLSSGQISVSKRKFKSLFEALGSIGGTNSIIFFALIIIYRPLNMKTFKKHLLKKVFPLIYKTNTFEDYDNYLEAKEKTGLHNRVTGDTNIEIGQPPEPDYAGERIVTTPHIAQTSITPDRVMVSLPDNCNLDDRYQEALPQKPSMTAKTKLVKDEAEAPMQSSQIDQMEVDRSPARKFSRKGTIDLIQEVASIGNIISKIKSQVSLDLSTPVRRIYSANQKDKDEERSKIGCCRRVFCCKKSKRQIEENARLQNMFTRVEESIDVINIVRDFNYLKILVQFLFRKEHKDLAQVVGFELWCKEQREAQEEAQDLKEALPFYKKTSSFGKTGAEDNIFILRQYEKCLEALQALDSQREVIPSGLDSSGLASNARLDLARKLVQENIDIFYGKLIRKEDSNFGMIARVPDDHTMNHGKSKDPVRGNFSGFVSNLDLQLKHNLGERPNDSAPPSPGNFPLRDNRSVDKGPKG